jgi:hypothetical protein
MVPLSGERVCGDCEAACTCDGPVLVPIELRAWGLIDSGFRIDDVPICRRAETVLDPDVTAAPFGRRDIVEIAAIVEGRDDGPPWVAIVRLADNRWVYIHYSMYHTALVTVWTYVFAAARDRLWWWACTEDDRDRLSASLTPDEQDDELVRLDAMLDSPFAEAREIALGRMRRRLLR